MMLRAKPVFFRTEKEKAEIILQSIREGIPAQVELTEESIISSFDDFSDLQESLEGVDVLLELTENLRPVPIRLYIRLGDFGLPLVVYGGEFYVTPRRIEAAGYWKPRGVTVYIPLTRNELNNQLAMLAAEHRIRNTRALLIDSRYNTPYVITSSFDHNTAMLVLGVKILSCSTHRYLETHSSIETSKVSALAEEWMEEASRVVEPTDKDLEKSARFYLAIKHLIEENRVGAVAINCLPFVEEIQGTPCMALVKLNDEGIPVACEGDLTALMTMVFMERLANRSVFMGNIIYANPIENIIEINHCVLPLCMKGYDQPKKAYVLRDYHNRGIGVSASYEPELNETVTVVRFSTDFKEMVFLTGKLLDFGEDHCRSNLRVQVPDVASFIRESRGNHHILVYGDHTKGIMALCEAFGITPVPV
jgi:L-fucose isomerase-like protein